MNIYNGQLDAFELYHQHQEESSSASSFSLTDGHALPALGHALAGSTGAAISNVCTYPLELIITRIQVQRQLRKTAGSADDNEYKNVFDAARKIYDQEGGIPGFYTGIVQDTSKTLADAFLFFLAYTFIRQHRLRTSGSNSKALPVLEELSVGFVAGAFAKLITTPIANIVTRKQTSALLSARSSNPSAQSSPSTNEIASQIRKEKGIQGFWSGYSASLILTLNPSITFFLYETFKRLLLPRSKRDKPPPAATFLMAAISKAIASSITYPFSLAKSRAQATSNPAASDSQKPGESNDASEPAARSSHRPHPLMIFTTLHKIYTTDGFPALYEGLSAEIIKGFFSHGITMILKESIHRAIIRLYETLTRLLRRYPYNSPGQLFANTLDRSSDLADQAKTAVVNTAAVAGARAAAEMEHAADAAKAAGEGFGDGMGRVSGWVMESANETVELVKDYVGNGEDGDESDFEWFDVWGWWHREGDGK